MVRQTARWQGDSTIHVTSDLYHWTITSSYGCSFGH